jgi:hypothetical protein
VDPLVIIGLAAIGAFIVWLSVKGMPAATFVVEVRGGVACSSQGTVTDAFLQEVTEQCRAEGIEQGEVRGISRRTRISLWFSAEFSPEVCQRLRNWWGIHGWSATRRRKSQP